MIEKNFHFTASDGKKIHVYRWLPDKEPWLVMQIAHGMAEHAGRYREFATFLTNNQIAVYANDHRGHGLTDKDTGNLGFFADKDGWKKVLDDMYALTHIIRREHPGKPVVLLGHSMGSLLARAYLPIYPDTLEGVILSGTSGESGFMVAMGKFIAWIQGLIYGKKKPSKLLNTLTFKKYNKPFKPVKTEFDWLSRDEQKVQEYIYDPLCGFVVSNRFFYDLLDLVQFINKKSTYYNTPNIPMLIFSGTMDPVGNFSKGVKKVYSEYLKAGLSKVTLKLYPDGRHEMLNEINREQVYRDILEWLKSNFQNS